MRQELEDGISKELTALKPVSLGYELSPDLPIGFMDSGMGGLSVLREARKVMPEEDFIYFGDSANAPYGTKPEEEIRRCTFQVVDYLLNRKIKGLAIACNTATSAAVARLRLLYPELPLVGIEPALKPAAERFPGKEILVMATPMTIEQEKFHTLLSRYENQAKIVPVPCAGLMEFVEQGSIYGDELDGYFEEHLGKYMHDDVKAIVLGCTHYPFLKKQLRAYLGERDVQLLDGSLGTSRELRRRLEEKHLLKTKSGEGSLELLNSAGEEKTTLAKKLLALPNVE